ncbi:MAG: hypothetical protein NTU85_02170 [Candidatus Kaiserbacteria bacterium]|nr:hypothetical protein [Candidatus Kaiserbacteria bacterium]
MEYLLVVVIVVIALVVVYKVALPLFLMWLAKESILATTDKEGTSKGIMRGSSFDHFIISFEGYHLNDPRKKWYHSRLDKDGRVIEEGKILTEEEEKEVTKLPDWEIVYHGKDNKKGFDDHRDSSYDDRSKFFKKLGLFWVGWPWTNKNVYVYGFEWNETQTNKNGDIVLLPRAEATDFIYVADFIYAIRTIGAETRDRLPVDVLTQITIAVRNPYRALFSGEDWMQRITAAINRHVRTFIGSHDYQDLISPKKKIGNGNEPEDEDTVESYWRKFSEPIIELNSELPDDKKDSSKKLIPPSGLKGRYGVEIRTADLQTMDLSGDDEEKRKNQAAATRLYAAEQDAEAERTIGQAKADVIEMIGKKEAAALAARLAIIEKSPSGELLAQLDAMQEASKGAGNTVIWANNPLIPIVAKALGKLTEGGDEK